MSKMYVELMLAPAGGIDVGRLHEVIDDLDTADVSDRAFLDALDPLVGFTVDGSSTRLLKMAKKELRWAVERLAELFPVDVLGAPGTEPVRVLVGEGDLDADSPQVADAVALVRGCPKLSAALYAPVPAVTLD